MKEQTKLTLREKVNNYLSESISEFKDFDKDNQNKLTNKIIGLIEKITHPQYFCPNCDEKMFFEVENNYFHCLNCDYKSIEDKNTEVNNWNNNTAPVIRGKVPSQVEKLLKETENNHIVDPNKGKNIRALADKMKSGKIAVTPEDDAIARAADPNIKGKINWV